MKTKYIKRIWKNTFQINYKKQKMLFNTNEFCEFLKDLQYLNIDFNF